LDHEDLSLRNAMFAEPCPLNHHEVRGSESANPFLLKLCDAKAHNRKTISIFAGRNFAAKLFEEIEDEADSVHLGGFSGAGGF
jgi:hypothetical protein